MVAVVVVVMLAHQQGLLVLVEGRERQTLALLLEHLAHLAKVMLVEIQYPMHQQEAHGLVLVEAAQVLLVRLL
jgi:hypothetical protein